MTIEFYAKKDFKGERTVVNRDMDAFGSGNKLGSTASIKLTSDSDKILLFDKKNWDGKVMYLSGKQNIPDIGDPKCGGKINFRNSIKSVRVSEFRVRLKYHIITRANGDRPRHKMSQIELESYLGKIRYTASRIWEDEALLRFIDDGFVYTENDELFNAEKCDPDTLNEMYPNLADGKAHVFIPNTINRPGCAKRRATHPGFFLATSTENHTMNEISRTLAHELGHSLNIWHGNNSDGGLLMTQTAFADATNNTRITRTQVETVHEGLSDTSGAAARYRIE